MISIDSNWEGITVLLTDSETPPPPHINFNSKLIKILANSCNMIFSAFHQPRYNIFAINLVVSFQTRILYS